MYFAVITIKYSYQVGFYKNICDQLYFHHFKLTVVCFIYRLSDEIHPNTRFLGGWMDGFNNFSM